MCASTLYCGMRMCSVVCTTVLMCDIVRVILYDIYIMCVLGMIQCEFEHFWVLVHQFCIPKSLSYRGQSFTEVIVQQRSAYRSERYAGVSVLQRSMFYRGQHYSEVIEPHTRISNLQSSLALIIIQRILLQLQKFYATLIVVPHKCSRIEQSSSITSI